MFAVLLGLGGSLVPAIAQNPLINAIDRLASQDLEWLKSKPESEGLMLRRLSLDLRMVVPTPEELEAYLTDVGPDRWQRWVQKFLADPLHKERLVDWLDKTLLQRRPHQHVDRAKWLTYLRSAVDEQRPLDQMAREIVSSVWWNQSERAQQRFFLERAGDPHAIARDMGRIFFGKDMQCAQCHDHPQVDDYLQIDYHGLLAYVSPSTFVEGKFKDDKGAEQKVQIYAEKAARDAPFESVFDKGIFYRTGTRVPGETEAFDPFETADESYQASAMPNALDGVPAAPRSSRRQSLVAQLTSANRSFATNWSNRIWAMMMGKGLVHPLDMHHADNPPTHPQLLNALTESLIASEFRIRPIIKRIALSDAYKIGARMEIESSLKNNVAIDLNAGSGSELERTVNASAKSLENELQSLTVAAESAKQTSDLAESQWKSVQKERVEIWAEIDKAEVPFKEILKKADAAKAALNKAKKLLDDAVSRQSLLDDAAAKMEQAQSLGLAADADFKQAIATTKTKAEANKAMVPSLEKAVADAIPLRDASQMALDVDRARVKEIAAKLGPIEQRLHTADAHFLKARSDWQNAQSARVANFNKILDLKRVQTWLEASKIHDEAETALAAALPALEQKKAAEKAIQSGLVLLRKDVDAQKVARAAVLDSLAQAEKVKNEKASQASLLQNTLDSIDRALSLVTETEPLIAAKSSLQRSLEAVQTSMQQSDAQYQGLIAESSDLSKRLESAEGRLASEEQELKRVEQTVALELEGLRAKEGSVKQAVEACSVALQAVAESRQKSGLLAMTRALSPEQFCLSIFQATGVLQNHVASETAELEKKSPLGVDPPAEQLAVRKLQATRQALDKLRPHLDTFANLYASGVGQTSDEFFASPDQALYMANGGSVFQWSASAANNVTSRVAQQPHHPGASKLLFWSVMSRDPTAEEEKWIDEMLSQAGEKKPLIVQELVWSLLTSSEFRVYP